MLYWNWCLTTLELFFIDEAKTEKIPIQLSRFKSSGKNWKANTTAGTAEAISTRISNLIGRNEASEDYNRARMIRPISVSRRIKPSASPSLHLSLPPRPLSSLTPTAYSAFPAFRRDLLHFDNGTRNPFAFFSRYKDNRTPRLIGTNPHFLPRAIRLLHGWLAASLEPFKRAV